MIRLDDVPASNTLDLRIQLASNGVARDTVDANELSVVAKAFDQAILVNGQVIRRQTTPGNFNAQPGNIAFIEHADNGGVNLVYGLPNGQETRINFT